MAHKIQIKRGNKADIPVLNDGEMGLCIDTQEVFVGSNGTNIPVGVQTEIVNNLTETVTGKALDATQGKVLDDKVTAMKRTPVVTKVANFTFALADEAQLVSCLSENEIVATIPKSTTVNFPVNTEIPILRYGLGEVTITPASGVTLNGEEVGIAIDSQYSTVMIKKMAVNEWLYVGVK